MFTVKLVCAFLAPAAFALADSITWTGPFPPDNGSVIGNHLDFDIQDATLTGPASGTNWTLTIHTNYGLGLTGEGENAAPSWRSYSIGDFLISWNGGFYGIVLHGHDGYAAGNLYQAGGFQTAREATKSPTYPDPTPAVWLEPGGTLLGTGTVRSAMYGDGIVNAESVITDEFQAPIGFLGGGGYEVFFSSATCGNATLNGSAPPAPEPWMLWLAVPGMLIAWRKFVRTA